MTLIPSDVRLAVRGLRRSPLFTAVAILSLALGFGANTAIFTLIDQILLRKLPVKAPDELVMLHQEGAHNGSNMGDRMHSYPMYKDFQQKAAPLAIVADMHFPNGSVITPDGKTLIVGETLGGTLSAFDINADGSLANRRVWAATWPRVPDGITLDADGHIWIANPIAPECALIAEGGDVLDVIDTGQPCYACMLGGEDGRTLFVLTARTSVAHEAAASPTGTLLMAAVDVPHAGRP